MPGGLHPAVAAAWKDQGIERLYEHQAEAIAKFRAGQSVVIVTGTASGKTLCYNIPVVETLLEDPLATALFIYPTKALTQDQLRGLGSFQAPRTSIEFLAGTYDGDTPQNLRRKLRDARNFVLTNPDMLHQGILPQHARWNRFFTHLKYVVIDEVHAYRGVFGSHLANVLRRLARICTALRRDAAVHLLLRHHRQSRRSTPSASPASRWNWSPTTARRAGRSASCCGTRRPSRDGQQPAARNEKPRLRSAVLAATGAARSGKACICMAALVQEGVQTIAFVRTRHAAELIFRNTRDLLRPRSPALGRRHPRLPRRLSARGAAARSSSNW